MRFKMLIPFALLAGCSHAQPGIEIRTVEVPVVQTQKCIAKKDVPQRPKTLKSEGTPADIEGALAAALAKVSEWTRYGNKVDILLDNCVE